LSTSIAWSFRGTDFAIRPFLSRTHLNFLFLQQAPYFLPLSQGHVSSAAISLLKLFRLRRIRMKLRYAQIERNQCENVIGSTPGMSAMVLDGVSFRGVTRVLGTVEGLHDSPYHGLNFCQGTVAEMLDDPAREIVDVIRWFGERGKIFNVHFRNIKGRKLDFMEAFPDEGDMDMPRSLAAYRDVGYQYMLMPDHVPQIDGRDPSGVAFAYCYGYIQALLDALVPRANRPPK